MGVGYSQVSQGTPPRAVLSEPPEVAGIFYLQLLQPCTSQYNPGSVLFPSLLLAISHYHTNISKRENGSFLQVSKVLGLAVGEVVLQERQLLRFLASVGCRTAGFLSDMSSSLGPMARSSPTLTYKRQGLGVKEILWDSPVAW